MKRMKRLLFVITILATASIAAPAFAVCGYCDYNTGYCVHQPDLHNVCRRIQDPWPPNYTCWDSGEYCGVGGFTNTALTEDWTIASVEVKRPDAPAVTTMLEPTAVASLETKRIAN